MEVNAFTTVIWLVLVGLGIWCAVDASSHPDWSWQRAGQNRMLWLILPLVLSVLCGIVGLVMVIVYFTAIKPKVVAAESGGAL